MIGNVMLPYLLDLVILDDTDVGGAAMVVGLVPRVFVVVDAHRLGMCANLENLLLNYAYYTIE